MPQREQPNLGSRSVVHCFPVGGGPLLPPPLEIALDRRLSVRPRRRSFGSMLPLARIVVVIVATVAPLSAQVFEWRDASGSRNYTNDVENIPEALREKARVVVRARPLAVSDVQPASSPASSDADVAAPDAVALDSEDSLRRENRARRRAEMARWREEREQRRLEREAPRGAQVVYDNSFRFERRDPAPAPQVNINITGPLAVSQIVVPESQPPIYAADPFYETAYEPLVSTSFDRGRYRHRTVRMRLQDQFQYDRNGPPIIVDRRIPLGPRFRAKLPRGVRSCSSTTRPRRRNVLRR